MGPEPAEAASQLNDQKCDFISHQPTKIHQFLLLPLCSAEEDQMIMMMRICVGHMA